MKIKFTFPVPPYEAGLIYDLPEKEAMKHVKNDHAFIQVEEGLIEVTAFGAPAPVFLDGEKQKKVKHGNG